VSDAAAADRSDVPRRAAADDDVVCDADDDDASAADENARGVYYLCVCMQCDGMVVCVRATGRRGRTGEWVCA
jgi:hypothetical protein